MLRFFISTLLFITLFSCAQVLTQSKEKDPILFSVAGDPVYKDEFVYVYSKNNQNNEKAFREDDIRGYLDLFINFKLKIKEGEAQGLDTTKQFKQEFNLYRDQLARPYLYDGSTMEALKREAYDRLKSEVKASHILLKVAPNASPTDTLRVYNSILDLRNQALSGKNFDSLAFQYSQDPSAKSNKGDLGYFTAFQMVYPFEDAAFTTNKGSVSMPIRTKFGYHIIKVVDRRPALGEVQVAHIMAGFRKAKTKEDSIAIQERIFEINDQLKGGADWDYLCKQYSDDVNSKNKGGILNPFGARQLPPSFEQVAFALSTPGQISDPFTTPFGWHIVKLIKKIPLAPYDSLQEELEAKIKRDARAKNEKSELIKRIKAENGFVVNKDYAYKAFNQMDPTLLKGQWVAPSEVPNDSLFVLGDRVFYTNDFFNFVVKSQRKQTPSISLEQYIFNLYEAYESSTVINYEKDNLAKKFPEYKHLVTEYREGIILFELMENEVWNKAALDSAGLLNYYNKNKKDYRSNKSAQGLILEFTDSLQQKKAIQMLTNNPKLTKDSIENTFNGNSSLSLRILEGNFEEEEHVSLSNVEWTNGVHHYETRDMFYVVVLHSISQEKQKDFKETKGAVIAGYQEVVEKEWIKQLKSKYSITRNKKVIENTINEIKK